MRTVCELLRILRTAAFIVEILLVIISWKFKKLGRFIWYFNVKLSLLNLVIDIIKKSKVSPARTSDTRFSWPCSTRSLATQFRTCCCLWRSRFRAPTRPASRSGTNAERLRPFRFSGRLASHAAIRPCCFCIRVSTKWFKTRRRSGRSRSWCCSGGTRYNRWSYLSMIPVCGGGIMCAMGEMNLHVIGILTSISSTVFRSLRVLIQARLLCDSPQEKGGNNSADIDDQFDMGEGFCLFLFFVMENLWDQQIEIILKYL